MDLDVAKSPTLSAQMKRHDAKFSLPDPASHETRVDPSIAHTIDILHAANKSLTAGRRLGALARMDAWSMIPS